MSRLRGRWLDDEGDDVGRQLPGASTSQHRKRGQWIDDEPAAHVGGGPRPGHAPIPKWVDPAKAAAFVILAFLGGCALLGNSNVAKALVVAPVLAWIAFAVAQRFAKADGEPAIVPILMGGLAVKFCGVMGHYAVSLKVYGRSDATEYMIWGRKIAPGLRQFHVINLGKLQGTNFVRLLTGIVFAITPASAMVGYLVFAFMSYIGMLFFWRALKRAMPSVPNLRYLQAIMLLPSLAFWPASIGKDSWMVMGCGIASYGVANILTDRTVLGWGSFIVGIYAMMEVRPHVGIALLCGLIIAELVRRRGLAGASRAGVSIALLFFFGGIIMSTSAAFLHIGNWSQASVTSELDSVAARTSEGGAEFRPIPVHSPAQFPLAAFTVLFRPMPYETHSPQEMLTAAEDIGMLGFILVTSKRLWAAFRRVRSEPYLLYSLGALSVFVIEYSSFSNFGLLARERSTITALLLVYLCLPKNPTYEEAPNARPGGSRRGSKTKR